MHADIAVAAPRPKAWLPVRLTGLADERLARLVADGADRAFAVLYERYHQPLYRYCRSIVRNETDAQDALQSAFASALVALRRGQRDAPLRPWLYRIAHNEAVSLLRRRRAGEQPSAETESLLPSIEDAAATRARLTALVEDLQSLPERQRAALVMRELSGLTHEEIASALQMSIGAAKQAVFEARRSLMEFAEGRAMLCQEIQRIVSDGDRRILRSRRVRAHLGDCERCAEFAAAIRSRRDDLHALVPTLPAAAAAASLASITRSSPAHAGGGGAVAAAGAQTASLALSAKALTAGALVAATAAAGAVGVARIESSSTGHHAPIPTTSGRHVASGATAGMGATGLETGNQSVLGGAFGSSQAGASPAVRAATAAGRQGTSRSRVASRSSASGAGPGLAGTASAAATRGARLTGPAMAGARQHARGRATGRGSRAVGQRDAHPGAGTHPGPRLPHTHAAGRSTTPSGGAGPSHAPGNPAPGAGGAGRTSGSSGNGSEGAGGSPVAGGSGGAGGSPGSGGGRPPTQAQGGSGGAPTHASRTGAR
jgi:RNA polymerase sigma factor (sigma-70 family)